MERELRGRRPIWGVVGLIAWMVAGGALARCEATPAAADFSWTPASPEIGQQVSFTIDGYGGTITQATWSFGGSPCGMQYQQSYTCTPSTFNDCKRAVYTYATSGTKNVTVQIAGSSGNANASNTITVHTSGMCSSTCTYSLLPTSRVFGAQGGTGTFEVTTGDGCSWVATTNVSWITIIGGGSSSVSYVVAANAGPARSAWIAVQNRYHTVNQTSASGGVDFIVSNLNPEIGEEVTLTVLGESTPVGWDLGGVHCDGSTQSLDCTGGLGQLCRNVTWRWATAGTKTITYTADEGVKQKTITVQNSGSCPVNCEAEGPPQADFTIDPDPAEVGHAVTFSYDAPGGGATATGPRSTATSFSVAPGAPEIGEDVLFTISGHTGAIQQATWDFGGASCDSGANQVYVCQPTTFWDCSRAVYTYASGGAKNVTLYLATTDGATTAQGTVSVQNTGSCGGGTTCSWSISPTSRAVDAAGATGSVSVSTSSGCDWTAISNNPSWLHLTGTTSGSGPGTVAYAVDANSGAARNGTLRIAGKTFIVSQAADPGGGDPATAWQWTVTLGDQTVATSSQASFTHSFDEPGTYTVSLIASNCAGQDSLSRQLTVVGRLQPTLLLVPAAAHATGQANTTWRTDLRLFNPGSEEIAVKVEFLPEAKDNSGPLSFIELNLPSRATRMMDDVLRMLPGLGSGDSKGALRITWDGGDGMAPVVMSRTYNDTRDGTYGQFVPAVAADPGAPEDLFLTGCIQNGRFRTNIGVNNLDSAAALDVRTEILDVAGEVLGSYTRGVPAFGSVQVVNAARAAGITTDLEVFSVRIEPAGAHLTAYASVVDHATGDSVLYLPSSTASSAVYVAGVAQIQGALGTDWNTDIAFFNPTSGASTMVVDYVPETILDFNFGWLQPLGPGTTFFFETVLEWLTNEPDLRTKGYFKIEPSESPGSVPLIAARTYNLNEDGTYGQALTVYDVTNLIPEGSRASIPGVENTEDFRTNLGLVNTSGTDAATVRLVVYDDLGEEIARISAYPLQPRQFVQFNLFEAVGLGSLQVTASVTLEVTSGGPVAAYASIIDNRTQDPIMVPATVLWQSP